MNFTKFLRILQTFLTKCLIKKKNLFRILQMFLETKSNQIKVATTSLRTSAILFWFLSSSTSAIAVKDSSTFPSAPETKN